ncbi:hypothetical protein K460107A9_18870 [Streptococcus pasteurianus]|jgi:hypothetical protein
MFIVEENSTSLNWCRISHLLRTIFLILTESNNRKQKNPIMFKRKSIGDSSLKKFDIETIRNPIDTIVEIPFFLSILTTSLK